MCSYFKVLIVHGVSDPSDERKVEDALHPYISQGYEVKAMTYGETYNLIFYLEKP